MSDNKTYKKLGNLPAFSFDISHQANFEHNYGINQRLYLMTHIEDHFENLDYETKKAIAGDPPKEAMFFNGSNIPSNYRLRVDSIEYAQWLIKGKVRYRQMLVEEILNGEL